MERVWLKLDYKSRILAAVNRYEEKRDADRKTGDNDEAAAEALKPKAKAKTKSKDPEEWTERQIQSAVATILDKLGVCWCHVPNEGKRSKIAGSLLRASGMKSGIPDILLFSRAPNKPEARGVAIELKRSKGGRVSENQAAWLKKLRSIGWYTVVCRGYAETIKELEILGYLKRG